MIINQTICYFDLLFFLVVNEISYLMMIKIIMIKYATMNYFKFY